MAARVQLISVETIVPENAFIYSRTDLKGRITEANEVFAEISGYSVDEMIGKPHSLVRHPDMPKEAFADLWKSLKAGRPWQRRRQESPQRRRILLGAGQCLPGARVRPYRRIPIAAPAALARNGARRRRSLPQHQGRQLPALRVEEGQVVRVHAPCGCSFLTQPGTQFAGPLRRSLALIAALSGFLACLGRRRIPLSAFAQPEPPLALECGSGALRPSCQYPSPSATRSQGDKSTYLESVLSTGDLALSPPTRSARAFRHPCPSARPHDELDRPPPSNASAMQSAGRERNRRSFSRASRRSTKPPARRTLPLPRSPQPPPNSGSPSAKCRRILNDRKRSHRFRSSCNRGRRASPKRPAPRFTGLAASSRTLPRQKSKPSAPPQPK